MIKLSKNFSLSACALAVALLVTACGGGDASGPPDTTPPTVAITDSVGDAIATGPVTFSFTFSEDVGSSFTAEDIVVTGGTAGAFTKTGLVATLVVTPPPNAAGTLDVSVAAGKFMDLAGNPNVASAMASQAFNTVVAAADSGNTGTCTAAPCIDFSGASVGFVAFEGLGSATIVADPVDPSNKVAKLVKVAAGQPWAGATIFTTDATLQTVDAIGFATSKIITLRVFSPAIGEKIMLKVETGPGGGGMEKEVLTTKAGQWETLTFDYASPSAGAYDPTKVYKTISFFPKFLTAVTADTTYYFDELKYAAASAPPVGCGTTAPTCAPATTVPAASVVIYNDAGNVATLDTFPVWGQSPPVVGSELTIAGNKVLKYTFGALYQGIDWSANPQDVSGKATVHLDIWSADVASLKVSLIGGGSENGIVKPLTAGAWNSLDIDLSLYTSPDKTKIIQFKLEPNAAGTIYVDNLFFSGTAAGGGGGGGGTFTGGIFSSDYSGNLGANTAKSDKGGTVGFFVDPRLFAVKIFEDGSVCGSACNPGGVFNFYYGIGKPAAPTYADAYFGAFVNAPGNTTADASSFAKIKLKFWGDAESWEKPNFTAHPDVVLQGPANAACTNPSGRPEITKAVTAQKIGAGSDYIIPKTDFVLTASCGGAYSVDTVWSAVGAVVVRLTGSSNLNYVNLTPSTPPSYPTFINIGPVSFIN